MYTALFIISGFLLLVSALPLSYSQHYLVRSCDFVRLQIAYLAIFMLVVIIWLAVADSFTWIQLSLLTINVISLALQSWWIYPYTVIAPKEVNHAQKGKRNSVRIMSANVLMSNKNSAALLDLVKRHEPDLLITLESDKWWQDELAPLKDDYPYSIDCAKDNRYGMHLFSKFKIKQAQVCQLVEEDVPSIHILFENAEGIEMQGHFIHPAPPSPTEEDTSRPRDSELVMVAKALKECKRPVIVAGDLNDVAWSRTTRLFMQISGLLDPRKGRGFFNTFHADYFFMRWPLDHLFHSGGFTVKRIKRLDKYGSDHFALLTELVHQQIDQQSTYEQTSVTAQVADELMMDHLDKHQVPTFD
ncbi:MAG: endonuclease/exonuclease/phosphatase family protein [Pseudoalteromonas sp.]